MKDEMLEEIPVKEFKDSGLLFFVNLVLQPLGISLVVEIHDNIYRLFPARTKYRGFSNESQDNGYKHLNEYLKKNIDKITDIKI
jgi:hypothetical protein